MFAQLMQDASQRRIRQICGGRPPVEECAVLR
jgi:hypothetical protein